MRRSFAVAVLIAALGAAPAHAVDLGSALKALGVDKKASLGGTRVGQGLKEALRVGVDRAVQLAGKKDGYLGNSAIKIAMPEKLRLAEGLMRKVGLGGQVDQLVLSMNRSAEAAAPHARDIFIDAITDMSIEDAEGLLKGGDTAATDYFRRKSSARLAEVYRPVVARTMSQYGVTAQYQALMAKYQALPLARRLPLPSIEDYTVNKALDGLYTVLGQEERRIRVDPGARATALLKEVFAS
ncbi:MAG: hypothetical protein MOGMAGMI_01433 [Candidatus Omnitrophica bacterium]|nr:hypothetical protein [Candidatus Omnitrophota bacterium]